MASCAHLDKRRVISVDSISHATVDLIVGRAQKKITVHKFLLCQTASYFPAALEGSFKEATEQIITMPEQCPEVIQRFVLWLYTGKILGSTEKAKDLDQKLLADLYIAGDIYGISELRNSVMDCFMAWIKTTGKFPSDILAHVYKNTLIGCRLQQFLVERAATKGRFSGKENWFARRELDFPQYFLMDLVQELYDHKKGTSEVIDWKNLGCRYHVHPEDAVESGGKHLNTSSEQGEKSS